MLTSGTILVSRLTFAESKDDSGIWQVVRSSSVDLM